MKLNYKIFFILFIFSKYILSVNLNQKISASYKYFSMGCIEKNFILSPRERHVLSLKNPEISPQGLVNGLTLNLKFLDIGIYTESSQIPAILRIRKNVDLIGRDLFTELVDERSVISYEKSPKVKIQGGTVLYNTLVGVMDPPRLIDFNSTGIQIFIAPGETLTITVQSTEDSLLVRPRISIMSISCAWEEYF